MDVTKSTRNFSSAAEQYDTHASLQKTTARRLLQLTPALPRIRGTVIDLGCGTGFFTQLLASRAGEATVIAIDRAIGMAETAVRRGIRSPVVGDAVQLPVRDNTCSFIFSNMALQWCSSLQDAIAECKRVLEPGGWLNLSMPGKPTLPELQESWKTIDDFEHVHEFPDIRELCALVAQSDLSVSCCESLTYRQPYESVSALMQSLRRIGASNVSFGRRRGLMANSAITAVEDVYPGRGPDGRIWATWTISYLRALKPFG